MITKHRRKCRLCTENCSKESGLEKCSEKLNSYIVTIRSKNYFMSILESRRGWKELLTRVSVILVQNRLICEN